MKSIIICLPEIAYATASTYASKLGVHIEGLCASVLTDHFVPPRAESIEPVPKEAAETSYAKPSVKELSKKFNVAEQFAHFPKGSIALAQLFVDEALKFPEVSAFKNKRGIGFKPNFVFIEYLMSRGGKSGIGVSFYGEPAKHENPPPNLVKGIPSYSRARIYSTTDLMAVLPHVKQSYELRYGKL